MPAFSQLIRFRAPRTSLLIILGVVIAACTSWATLTAYTAKLAQANNQSTESPARPRARTKTERANLNKSYGKLPLSFEANVGQTDANVKYLAHGPGYNIFLNSAEAVLVFQNRKADARSQGSGVGTETREADEADGPELDRGFRHGQIERLRQRAEQEKNTGPGPTIVHMRLDGANANPRATEGVDELPGKVNYFVGNDSSKWLTDIPTYGKVAYRDVYPGVDLVYYGNRQQLEYDLVIGPGTDPSVVKVKYEGAEKLRVDREGNLRLETEAGEIQQPKPLVYQEENGERKLIEGHYVMRGRNRIGFRVSRYNRHKPLVIDPKLVYLSLVNGGGDGYAIAVDTSGFAYITGTINASTLNPSSGAFQTTFGGVEDAFVTKLNQAGDQVIYSTYLGGSDDDFADAIAVDAQGNAYVTGYGTAGYPTTPGAYQTTVRGGSYDCVVTKLNPAGNGLVFSTFYGGNDYEEGDGIAVDQSGNVYVAGTTTSTDLVTTAGAALTTNSSGDDGFAIQLNPTGTALRYATYFGGGGFDVVNGTIAIDNGGNAYISGETNSLNFPQVNSLMGPGGLDRGLFKSANGGSNWALSRNGLTTSYVYSLAVDKTTPTTVYAGTGGGVSKSTDSGANWTATAPTNSNIQALVIDPSNSSIVYAGSNSFGNGGIFKTTNGGASWVNTRSALVQALAIDPTTPATVYAGTTNRVLKTTNGGGSWSTTGLSGIQVRSVAIDPSAPATVYAATNSGVFKTTNGGTTWFQVNTGLPNLNVRALAVVPNAPATIYAGTGSGVFKTVNGGTNWSAANNNLLVQYTDNVARTPLIGAIAIDPITPSTVYAASNSVSLSSGPFPLSTIFKSTDSGASWIVMTNGFGSLNNGFFALAINPANPAVVYAGNNGDFDGFLVRVNSTGTALLNSTYLGSSRNDFAAGVTLDTANNAYVVGYTQSATFPVTAGAFQTNLKGSSDAFVMKLNSTLSSLVYSTYLGGTGAEFSIGGIAVDGGGNAHVAGYTFSTDFPVTAGSFQTTIGNRNNTAASDDFVAKLNPSGSALVYSSYLGGAGSEPKLAFFGNYLALDPAGNAYLVGNTTDANTFPYFNITNGFGETFVAKIDAETASYSITGRITTIANAPIAGVRVEASNGRGFSRSGVSDNQGFYSIISLPAGDYTVKPDRFGSSGHYLFTPTSRTFTGLNSDQTANFIGAQVYDIQGQVTSSTVPGLGIFDVTITLSGAASATTITDANGSFAFQDLVAGNYTVTPSKTGFTFNPVNLSYTNLSADQFASFTTASTTFFTVSGRVADAGNTGIANVVISIFVAPMRGFRTLSTQTDANGNYSIPNLQAGGNYSFLPLKPVLSFTPQNPTFNNLSSNQTLNFLAAPVTGLIGKIAFTRSNMSTEGISVINADGTGELSITNNFDEEPTWSPDGSRLAFAREDSGNSIIDIYVMNADGSGVTRLTNAPLEDLFPSWSPDATHLTFTYGECSGLEAFTPEIFVTDAAGTVRTRLTNNSVVDAFSDWSPTGSTIAFARGATVDCDTFEDQADIYAMDPDGSNQRILANNSDGESRPAYSPDGSKIAYFRASASSVGAALYVMNADGTGQTKISPDLDPGDSGKPTWSPDGKRIAFAADLFGVSQIFVINADGTGLAQITGGTLSRFDPSWQHFSISGRVNGNINGLPMTMVLAGTLTRVTQTDANGNYVFGNLTPGGNYSVSPVSTAFGFNPAKIDINNLVGNQIANFTVLPQVIPAPSPPLADDFSGAQRDPAKWNLGTQTQPLGAFDAQIPVVQQNGQLVITPRTQTDGPHYNGYVSVNSFDFNNSTATVEVAQTATNGADTIFAIGSDLDNFSRFVVRAGSGAPGVSKPARNKPRDTNVAQLIFQVKVGGQLTSLSIPYDPVADRFMRFRHEPPTNSIVFETSPNNIDFTVQNRVVLQKGVSALTCELSAGTSSSTNPGQAIFDNLQLVTNTIQFSAPALSVGEGDGSATITVTRSGSTANPATVDYATFDDTAQQRTKYIPAVGTLTFAPGESSKTFSVLIEDNKLVEGSQTLFLRLLDSSGAGLNSPGRAVLTITDNDSSPASTNPMDDAPFFVRQHYYDFLNRAPDPDGLAYWTGQITQCGSDQACIRAKRIDVSNAFFFEQEYQQTAAYDFRLYRAAYGNNQPFPNPDATNPAVPTAQQTEAKKIPNYAVFSQDRARLIGSANLAQDQLALANAFVPRAEFLAKYPSSLSLSDFVDAILTTIRNDDGVDLTLQRSALIALGSRGAVIYRLANDDLQTGNGGINNRAFIDAEYNRSFVAAEYFGYLRRDADIGGFLFWLGQVNSGPLRDGTKQHGMVCSFITSAEYQQRFSPVATHTNQECPQ